MWLVEKIELISAFSIPFFVSWVFVVAVVLRQGLMYLTLHIGLQTCNVVKRWPWIFDFPVSIFPCVAIRCHTWLKIELTASCMWDKHFTTEPYLQLFIPPSLLLPPSLLPSFLIFIIILHPKELLIFWNWIYIYSLGWPSSLYLPSAGITGMWCWWWNPVLLHTWHDLHQLSHIPSSCFSILSSFEDKIRNGFAKIYGNSVFEDFKQKKRKKFSTVVTSFCHQYYSEVNSSLSLPLSISSLPLLTPSCLSFSFPLPDPLLYVVILQLQYAPLFFSSDTHL